MKRPFFPLFSLTGFGLRKGEGGGGKDGRGIEKEKEKKKMEEKKKKDPPIKKIKKRLIARI